MARQISPDSRIGRIFSRRNIVVAALLGLGYALYAHPPVQTVGGEEMAVRRNQLTGTGHVVEGEAEVWVWPVLHTLRRYPVQEQEYRPFSSADADAGAPLQSADGLSVYAELSLRYAADAERVTQIASLPNDLGKNAVEPATRSLLRKHFARYSMAEIFQSKRHQLQEEVRTELSALLAEQGVSLRAFALGDVALLHGGQRLTLQDRIYRPERSASARGEAPLQTVEGLSIGVELSIRYALDAEQLSKTVLSLPDDIDGQRVEPLVQGVIYPVLSRYSVREIFSTKRPEVQQSITDELEPLMQADGLLLRSVMLGNIDLPADYRAGMDRMLAAELQNEQMKFTLQLKEKEVKQSELQAEADKVRREKQAEASAREQVIAARAQEEAMRHVLPFKQQQIEQRKLEAEADKLARVKKAEALATARKIEAAGEAESRQLLADAEAYRLEQLGRVASAQLERDGALIDRYPLMIQKTLADKLSDKVQVIIAPPPADGGFIGNTLLSADARQPGGRP